MRDRVLSDAINTILGKPYRLRGRGPEAYDCLGVVLHVLRAVGYEIDDPIESLSVGECVSRMRGRFLRLHSIGCAAPGDVLYSRDATGHQGVGIVETRSKAATALDGVGVARVRWCEIGPESGLEVYRLKERCFA